MKMASSEQVISLTRAQLGRVVIADSDGEDEKFLTPVTQCQVVAIPRPLLKSHPAMARGMKANKPIAAWLSYYGFAAGAANTAFATQFPIQPSQDSSWASWQAVFDEFKVLEAEIIWNTFYTTDPTVLPANSSNSVIVYDPASDVTLASVNAGLQFERYSLCRNMIPTAAGPKVSPMVFTKDGFLHFKTKISGGVVNSTVGTLNRNRGQWSPTGDAVAYDYGSFQAYTSVGGVTSVLRIEGFIRMKVEFRVRR